MVLGWRRAFCTTIPRDQEKQDNTNPSPNPSPRSGLKFKFFSSSSSNPSTPRLQSQQLISSPNNKVKLRCKTTPPPPSSMLKINTPHIQAESPKLRGKTTKNSPRFFSFSNPSSPRSPSTFSFLKSSLLNSKSRCCICLQTMKTGQAMAIFTAECNHSFHFPCVAAHVRKESALVCPVCSTTWKEMPVLSIHNVENSNHHGENKSAESRKSIHINTNTELKPKPNPTLKVYNDDEPLMSTTSCGRFNTIPESDEENENVEFRGLENNTKNVNKVIDVKLSSESALISVGRSSETYAMVMKVKSPSPMGNSTSRRAPIDLVTVLDVSSKMSGDNLEIMKKSMRILLSTLSAYDRLSIVAFSTVSKRVLPLRRMTTSGKRSARRIVKSIVEIEGPSSSSTDALKKAVKVLEDRREKNPVTAIILLCFDEDAGVKNSHIEKIEKSKSEWRRLVTSSRISNLDISVHTIALAHEFPGNEELLTRSIGNIVSVFVQDISVRLGFISGSAPAEIAAVYECTNRPEALGSGLIRLGELYADEERELLVELKVPKLFSSTRSRRVLVVRCSYKDPFTQEVINSREQALMVPRFEAVGSSGPGTQRLKSVFIAVRALAEGRRLIERNEMNGAHHMLSSARALLLQSRLCSSDEFIGALEAELSELSRKKLCQPRDVSGRGLNVERDVKNGIVYLDEKAEPLTPTSAWRAAEKLAKLAIIRKSMHRVSDLHGFENARF
ncbi:ion channel [Lithospermum erythrorhizon]|uniref:Ion channel n=1 Tax=Lithospermum erythrorhizon TaxID=34254 RepID=A0AAV3RYT4_LITER